ncbi:hypothetical protein Lpl43_06015 [Lactiplantibacillus plantarum]|nr:hypothetical protein CEB41_07285 [Lactiplantibacillus plantarum]KYK05511.1 hypothetical protein Lpl43_06015 [Lactiplantibacillus plantarum]MCT3234442.1 hypothetical protein [Lactiplantibacillus plantarum]BEI53990.1 hypothetical protein AWA2045_21210 [Lactiplantibacillus plantarum]
MEMLRIIGIIIFVIGIFIFCFGKWFFVLRTFFGDRSMFYQLAWGIAIATIGFLLLLISGTFQ